MDLSARSVTFCNSEYIVTSKGCVLMIYKAFKVTLDYKGLVGPWHWWTRFQTKMEPDWWDGMFSYSFEMKHQTFAGLQDWLHILSRQEPEATIPQSPDCDALCLGESGEEKQRESGGSRWSRWTEWAMRESTRWTTPTDHWTLGAGLVCEEEECLAGPQVLHQYDQEQEHCSNCHLLLQEFPPKPTHHSGGVQITQQTQWWLAGRGNRCPNQIIILFAESNFRKCWHEWSMLRCMGSWWCLQVRVEKCSSLFAFRFLSFVSVINTHHIYHISHHTFNPSFALLAPTGALVLMMC